MRAGVYQTAGAPLAVERLPDPEPHVGQVIVEVAYSGICGSDLHLKSSGYLQPGTVMGHEYAGEITAIGAGVAVGWRVGDRVTALPLEPCRACEACGAGLPGLCVASPFVGTSLKRQGAYAEYVAADAGMLQRLPAGVSFTDGALTEPLAVAHHAVELGEVKAGEAVLVLGGGPIGAGVALFARMMGARHVVVSEPAAERRALALQLGATATIDATVPDVPARFHEIAGRRPDVVFECVGVRGVLQQAIACAGLRGRVVVAGVCFGEDAIQPVTGLMKEVSVRFSQAYTERDFAAVIDAMAERRIEVEPMRTDVIGLDALPGAFDGLSRAPRSCKVLIDPKMEARA